MSSRSMLRTLVISFSTAIVILSLISAADAQQRFRNFRMGLWNNPTGVDADIPFFKEGEVQPRRPAILQLSSWQKPGFAEHWLNTVSRQYDLRRLEAVIIDEPYWSVFGTPDWSNPCRDSRLQGVLEYRLRLRMVADLIKETSPNARLWINFSEPEMLWMMDPGCPLDLNEDFIDVASLDVYWKSFEEGPQRYYDWLLSHPGTERQQIALVPGTFYRGALDDPIQQASFLPAFFDYARQLNESCDGRGVLRFRNDDGRNRCVVWMVAGWLGPTHFRGGISWRGEQDPSSQAIHLAWMKEFRRSSRPRRIENFHSRPSTFSRR